MYHPFSRVRIHISKQLVFSFRILWKPPTLYALLLLKEFEDRPESLSPIGGLSVQRSNVLQRKARSYLMTEHKSEKESRTSRH